jgi:hypothetical protein
MNKVRISLCDFFTEVRTRISREKDVKEVTNILHAFFASDHSTYINIGRLRSSLGGSRERYDLLIRRISERIDREIKQGKAIETHGCIGDDGAGLDPDSSFMRAYREANEKGMIWYHFDAELVLYGISRRLPDDKGKAVQVV